MDGKLVVQSSATDIILTPVANAAANGTIFGDVTSATGRRSVLIVVEGPAGTPSLTGFLDTDGDFSVHNVPPGQYTVTGYASGIQLTPE